MAEIKKQGYVDHITESLRKNEQFIKENLPAKDAHDEIVELINDMIDLLGQLPDTSDKFVRSAKYNFILTNLMPSSYSILFNFLAGNVPTCFMQIRLIIESLVESFVADKEYPNKEFFYEKLERVEDKRYKERVRLYQFIKTVDEESADLWTSCSKWGHAQTLSRKMIDLITSDSVPVWSLVIPMPYDQNDEQSINELQGATKQLRNILKRTIESWR